MVLFWNTLPFIVFAIAAGVVLWARSVTVTCWTVAIAATFLFLYPKVQPSYLPKGDIQRSELPAFEPSKAEIEDRNRKPVDPEVRDARQKEQYELGSPALKRYQ